MVSGQLWATSPMLCASKYLRDMGHEVYLIRHNIENDEKQTLFLLRAIKVFNPFVLYRYLKSKNIINM